MAKSPKKPRPSRKPVKSRRPRPSEPDVNQRAKSMLDQIAERTERPHAPRR